MPAPDLLKRIFTAYSSSPGWLLMYAHASRILGPMCKDLLVSMALIALCLAIGGNIHPLHTPHRWVCRLCVDIVPGNSWKIAIHEYIGVGVYFWELQLVD